MKETIVSCKVPNVGARQGGQEVSFSKDSKSTLMASRGRVLLLVVFLFFFVFNVSDLLLSKASFQILHSIFPVWSNS